MRFQILILTILLWIVGGECRTQRLAQVSQGEPGKAKGDLGDVSPPVVNPPMWNDILRNTGVSTTHQNKGDLGVMDPRGTIRWNILPNGMMAKGIITSLADENMPITQAKEITSHSAKYARIG